MLEIAVAVILFGLLLALNLLCRRATLPEAKALLGVSMIIVFTIWMALVLLILGWADD